MPQYNNVSESRNTSQYYRSKSQNEVRKPTYSIRHHPKAKSSPKALKSVGKSPKRNDDKPRERPQCIVSSAKGFRDLGTIEWAFEERQ